MRTMELVSTLRTTANGQRQTKWDGWADTSDHAADRLEAIVKAWETLRASTDYADDDRILMLDLQSAITGDDQ